MEHRGTREATDAHDDLGRDLVLTIRLGPDGRVYFHDLTADMLPVAAALCPGDTQLAARLAAASAFAGGTP